MQKIVDAVYEGGLLRPLQPLSLDDQQQIRIIIDTDVDPSDPSGFFSPEEWEAAKKDNLSLADLRKSLASMRGSLADAVIEARNEERS